MLRTMDERHWGVSGAWGLRDDAARPKPQPQKRHSVPTISKEGWRGPDLTGNPGIAMTLNRVPSVSELYAFAQSHAIPSAGL